MALVTVKLEGGSVREFTSTAEDRVLTDIWELAQVGFTPKERVPNTTLQFASTPAFGKTHILVYTETRNANGRKLVTVYGIECHDNDRLTYEQVSQRVKDVFDVDVSDGLTPFEVPPDKTREGDAYPCGTLFTTWSDSSQSRSYSPPFYSPVYSSPSRPDHLYLNDQPSRNEHSPDTPKFSLARSVAHLGDTQRETMITGNANISNNACFDLEAGQEDLSTNQCRNGPMMVHTGLPDTLAPIQKSKGGVVGETILLGNLDLETPSKGQPTTCEGLPPKILLTVQDKPLFDIPSSQTHSQETDQNLSHGHHERTGSLVTPNKTSMVVGIEPQRRTSVGDLGSFRPTFGRHLSLPGEKKPTNLPIRNSSDTCLTSLAQGALATSDQASSFQNAQPVDTPVVPVAPLLQDLSAYPAGSHHVQPASDTLLTNANMTIQETNVGPSEGNSHLAPLIRGYTPTSPTKPLAIQRQESTTAAEFVAPKNNFDARGRRVQIQASTLTERLSKVNIGVHSSNGELGEPIGNTVADEVGASSLEVGGENGECGEDVVCESREGVNYEDSDSGEGGFSGDDVPCEGSESEGYISSNSSFISGSPSFKQQVHLLEHAMNNDCHLKDQCKNKEFSNLEFAEGVKQMESMMEEARDGRLSSDLMDDLKSYIQAHAWKCREGKDCRIPHQMGGCLPAGSPSSKSTSTPPKDTSTSFDQEAANQSTSSDVQRHFAAHRDVPNHPPRVQTPPKQLPFIKLLGRDRQSEGIDLAMQSPRQLSQDQTAPFSPHRGLGWKHQASPMGSGGFTPHRRKAQQVQESQIGTEQGLYGTNMRQVSDTGRSEQKPTERRQYSYLEPSRQRSGLRRQMYGGAERKCPTVRQGDFPNFSAFAKCQPGTMIYSTKDMQDGGFLVQGEVYPYPQDVDNLPKRDKLGEGGNGKVVKYPLNNREFALKHTHFRTNELNTWSPLSHKNILPLQGVMIGEPFAGSPSDPCRGFCYQFMPKMTDNLRQMMKRAGDLCTLLKSEDKGNREVIMANVFYILECIVSGLQYLHSLDIQHCDLKASNILILKKCNCQDIFRCTCPKDSKYEVRIADFDSVKRTKFPRRATQLPNVNADPMAEDMLKKVMGTPAYRAPEQFRDVSSCRDHKMFKKTMKDGQACFDMEGPWCDMWSLGVIILQIILGTQSTEEYINQAGKLECHQTTSKMGPHIEALVAILKLNKLLKLAHDHPELKQLASVTGGCLEIDIRKRQSAEEILKILQE